MSAPMAENMESDSPPSAALHWRLDLAPAPVRALATAFLCAIGLGLLAAQANLYLSHRHADGDPAFSMADIVADLHGREGGRPLVAALNGEMRQYVDSEEEAEALIAWAMADAPEREYHLSIADIFSERCVRCHGPGGESSDRPLTSYGQAQKVSLAGWHAPTWEHIARITHTHLLPLAVLWTLVGAVTVFSGPPSWSRAALAILPLAGIVVDAAGVWLAPLSRPMVWLVVAGGAAMGLGFFCQFVLAVYSLWLRPLARRKSTGEAG